ncbi:unnamed protein product [Rotaria magnacalcarata]|uniref:Mitochondrial ribosomal protein L41 n=6 Tax=Rotaria magnacalcarata TaxID=392030 RepID=A0A816SPS7_9BILA|nr:unnamed protein product [Rotaria magnacalcarata]CAF1642941.1 unnamed protein product [Rotaria magnacalcarata]CAF2034812.1 unnamed protein product [Rotaria magnacalcarata]CAF2051225.1 unnamed protein product [Rotaria magnacalcarata]CAF2087606.1 unnamed protein product [Rotaria magnacalcarata]
MFLSKDLLLKSLLNNNHSITIQRTFALSSIHFRRRIKHPTYQYFPYQKYDSANPIPHRDRVPVWSRLQLTTKMASEHKPGGHKLWHAMYMAHRGVQMPGYFDHQTAKFVYVEEMEPELVVPDLTDFKLKPYVSYDVTDIKQGQFLARDLFNATYAKSIADEFKRGQIKAIDDNNEENTEKTNSLS